MSDLIEYIEYTEVSTVPIFDFRRKPTVQDAIRQALIYFNATEYEEQRFQPCAYFVVINGVVVLAVKEDCTIDHRGERHFSFIIEYLFDTSQKRLE